MSFFIFTGAFLLLFCAADLARAAIQGDWE